MKVGDKILCKKDYDAPGGSLYKKGKYYTIQRIEFIDDYDKIFANTVSRDGLKSCDWVKFEEHSRDFAMLKMGTFNYFCEYFESDKEIRRRKLKKISDEV